MIPLHLIIINLCPGQYNTKTSWLLNCNTAVDVWVAGFGQIWPGEGAAASFFAVHFWTNLGRWGVWWAIAKLQPAGQIWSVCPIKLFKHTTINHRVAGLWLNLLGDGKATLFCGRQNSTKFQCLGGGLPIAKSHPAGQIQWVRPVRIFKHTTIIHRVAGPWPNWPGNGKEAPFCGRDNSTKIWPFWGVVRHSQIATSGPNLIGPPGQNIQAYHNQPSGGWALAELAGRWARRGEQWQWWFNFDNCITGKFWCEMLQDIDRGKTAHWHGDRTCIHLPCNKGGEEEKERWQRQCKDWPEQQDEERAAQQETTQQPAGAMIGQEGSTMRGWEGDTTRDNAATSRRNKKPRRGRNKRTMRGHVIRSQGQQEDKKRVTTRGCREEMGLPAVAMRRWESNATRGNMTTGQHNKRTREQLGILELRDAKMPGGGPQMRPSASARGAWDQSQQRRDWCEPPTMTGVEEDNESAVPSPTPV